MPYYHRYNIRTSKVPSGHIYIPLLGLLGNDLKVDKFIINSPASPQYWDIYAYRVAQLGTFIGCEGNYKYHIQAVAQLRYFDLDLSIYV